MSAPLTSGPITATEELTELMLTLAALFIPTAIVILGMDSLKESVPPLFHRAADWLGFIPEGKT